MQMTQLSTTIEFILNNINNDDVESKIIQK